MCKRKELSFRNVSRVRNKILQCDFLKFINKKVKKSHQSPTMETKLTFKNVRVYFLNAMIIYYALSIFKKSFQKC